MQRITTLHVALVCSVISWLSVNQSKDKYCCIVHGKKFGTAAAPARNTVLCLESFIFMKKYFIGTF